MPKGMNSDGTSRSPHQMPLVTLECPECGNRVGAPEGSVGSCDGKLDRQGRKVEHRRKALRRSEKP